MTQERIANRFNDLVNQGISVSQTWKPIDRGTQVDLQAFYHWRSASVAALGQVFGETHTYSKEFSERVSRAEPRYVDVGLGILRAARDDLYGGWLTRVTTMITADVFIDFLDMAEHLLANNYYHPAASLIGAVLEDGLRKISDKHSIALEPRETIDSLNVKLRKATIYTMLVARQVDVWREVRNNADHGQFTQFTKQDVEKMLNEVRDFLARYLS
jgi:hypothetical protein